MVRSSISRCVVMAMGLFGISGAAGPASAAVVPSPKHCAISPATLTTVLGVTRAGYVAGPQRLGDGTCSWHSNQPNCFVRTLSTTLLSDPASVRNVRTLERESSSLDAVDVDTSPGFFFHDVLPVGAAISIETLYVKRSPTSWLKVTLAGRLAPDGSPDLLLKAARAAV